MLTLVGEIDRLETYKKILSESVLPELVNTLEDIYRTRIFSTGDNDSRKISLRLAADFREEVQQDQRDKVRLEAELADAKKRYVEIPKCYRDRLKEYRECHQAEISARIMNEIVDLPGQDQAESFDGEEIEEPELCEVCA